MINFWVICLVNLPQLTLILYFSIKYFDRFNSCDRPLNLWLILYGIRVTASTIIASLPIISPRRWAGTRRFDRVYHMVHLFGFMLIVMGAIWVFSISDCKDRNPHIYNLCWWLLVIQYFFMALPCMVVCCLAPCVFFCLPLLIHLSGWLPAGVGLRGSGQHGASESLIEKLPSPFRFQRGMLGSSTKQTSRENSPNSVNHDEPEWSDSKHRTHRHSRHHPHNTANPYSRAYSAPSPFCFCRL